MSIFSQAGNQPWVLNFSYGRALQASVPQVWRGKAANKALAPQTLLKRGAAQSQYTTAREHE